jgi:hypothetical protein
MNIILTYIYIYIYNKKLGGDDNDDADEDVASEQALGAGEDGMDACFII